ncbi:hypothetical protein [Haliscomenobacter hydrossis]|uniref:Secreted protein n=1 Tax=Haliscomenobacter hydrossis (strain ATCC 27775 / DSM 1100 / LMG 10767 / O) TaxID=760192 RepID=F4KV56_HALH1|nr:hypothetical protein [Haliscomenobacter hydrossis]AEE49222.1 secreted protein [Haliscomenobacter hydrossis DSM 1100]
MKKISFSNLLAGLVLISFALPLAAQQQDMQYFRPWDKNGINVFEPIKGGEQPEYKGLSVRIGGSFTQDYQSLTHENRPYKKNYLWGTVVAEDSASAKLSGFNLAMANLNFDFQIEDGIRVCLENYMSSRHHNEFWVKGGYIQIDKLPMFGSPQWFTDYVRVKIGHFQPNFGDQQFRRTDGGNAIFNAFAENLILDAFTTEIGGEVYLFPAKGLMLMAGMTSGLINGSVDNFPSTPVGTNKEATKRNPSISLKAAYDNTFGDLRFRLSASMYNNGSSSRNTLYSGDRTGSHYFMVLEPAAGTYSANFTSGRVNPGITNRITAISINPFVKFKGLEVFGTYETIKGGTYAETSDRSWNQLAVEGIFRFLPNEQLYLGARYNTVSGRPSGAAFTKDVTINRTALVAGWFPTKNLLLKGEIVSQKYLDFPTSDIRNSGKFNGMMVEAVIGF